MALGCGYKCLQCLLVIFNCGAFLQCCGADSPKDYVTPPPESCFKDGQIFKEFICSSLDKCSSPTFYTKNDTYEKMFLGDIHMVDDECQNSIENMDMEKG
ncbi:unnamed protein product [Schistosoma curassoni]|uniref:Secretory peptide n=1 Tax=Schistosoma curassoni TaxID=6186 RepID=A0A183K7L4_9TREM|nr:unnamed protein product [Schistosoma curassoni]